jgi:N-acetylmuramoyl-L-alanine amidase
MTAMIDAPSPNHGPRRDNAVIDMIIIHYTGMASGPAALDLLRDPQSEVSSHYLIEEDGRIFALVPEDRRAWHAGVSFWAGNRDVNSRSFGIELVNGGHEFDCPPFDPRQMSALDELCLDLIARHKIPARHVLGHSDIAIGRKIDPGEFFDWRARAHAGIGLWPDILPAAQGNIAPVDPVRFRSDLAAFGYDAQEPEAIMAFQRHFRPQALTGIPDQECAAILAALLSSIS